MFGLIYKSSDSIKSHLTNSKNKNYEHHLGHHLGHQQDWISTGKRFVNISNGTLTGILSIGITYVIFLVKFKMSVQNKMYKFWFGNWNDLYFLFLLLNLVPIVKLYFCFRFCCSFLGKGWNKFDFLLTVRKPKVML